MSWLNTLEQSIVIWKKKRQYDKYVVPFIRNNDRSGTGREKGMPISLFSNARGGSTWLSELFSHLPLSSVIWEPMNLHNSYKELKATGFCWNQYIPDDARWPEAEHFFRKLYDRKIDAFRLYAVNDDMRKIPGSQYFIFKFVGSNLLIPWLTNNFDVPAVYLVRHPCAVVSSQLKYHHLFDDIIKNPHHSFPGGRHNDDLIRQFRHVFDSLTLPEERLAAEWAITNLVPLSHPANDLRWITISYEKLYKHPEEEVDRIFGRLGIAVPAGVYASVKKASSTAVTGAAGKIHSGGQLDSWRKHLSPAQINAILTTVKKFGADFYDDSSEPDYSKIYQHPVLSGKS